MTARGALIEPFATEAQQHEAATMGLWLFVATELMLFGGLFLGLAVYRVIHPQAAEEASNHLHLWIGGANTAVLLTSSLAMALAVVPAGRGRRRCGCSRPRRSGCSSSRSRATSTIRNAGKA